MADGRMDGFHMTREDALISYALTIKMWFEMFNIQTAETFEYLLQRTKDGPEVYGTVVMDSERMSLEQRAYLETITTEKYALFMDYIIGMTEFRDFFIEELRDTTLTNWWGEEDGRGEYTDYFHKVSSVVEQMGNFFVLCMPEIRRRSIENGQMAVMVADESGLFAFVPMT